MSVFLAYHYPCLDGTYAVTISFLFFREIQKRGISSKQFIEYISQFEDYNSINKSIYEWNTPQKNIDDGIEETKTDSNKDLLDEYSPKIVENIEFLPTRVNPNAIFCFPYGKYSETHLKNSIMIYMDYSGGSAENVIEVSQKFGKHIILDHHLTLQHIIAELKEKNVRNFHIIFS